MSLTFIWVLRNDAFQQDNTQLHADDIVQTFLETENVRLLPWFTRSLDFSPIDKGLVNGCRATDSSPYASTLLSMNYGVLLKLHGQLYLFILSDIYTTQCSGI